MTPGLPVDVSRETIELLQHYKELILKWNRSINLISPSTVAVLWDRHISDSVETVYEMKSVPNHWLDLGSGGGLPGIVAAIRSKLDDDPFQVTLLESDTRKCAFLRTVSRELNLSTEVVCGRIEEMPPQNADVISARALAPLPKLLGYCLMHSSESTQLILPKGQAWKSEVEEARKHYEFSLEVRPSVTQEGSVNLVIEGLKRG
ncbi:16S rRNA (guanine(527)-N(7))-methyltransferase RsmG [Primorskyibacter sp. S187A]|uniref:16S rRNA (guanine(527)-N(7))-methyltransferase RsmG n=1 Tax=Primorskyibacter sp. S187A TaxID=3415130 RepID=UPI003C7C450C